MNNFQKRSFVRISKRTPFVFYAVTASRRPGQTEYNMPLRVRQVLTKRGFSGRFTESRRAR